MMKLEIYFAMAIAVTAVSTGSVNGKQIEINIPQKN